MPSRKFRADSPILYNRYDCRHGEWLEAASGDDLGEAYQGGFLPYSASSGKDSDLFYMGRSLRVDLGRMKMDKKRRYSHRLWQRFGLARTLLSREAFLERYEAQALVWARDWMASRFGQPYLDESRLEALFAKSFLRDVLTWSGNGHLQAFALIVHGGWGAHYWFSFYRNGSVGDYPPGHGYMGDFLEWARMEGLPHAYLGTAYGEKSRYKSRGLQGIEFWDGLGWNSDREVLSRLRREDDAEPDGDETFPSGATQVADDALV